MIVKNDRKNTQTPSPRSKHHHHASRTPLKRLTNAFVTAAAAQTAFSSSAQAFTNMRAPNPNQSHLSEDTPPHTINPITSLNNSTNNAHNTSLSEKVPPYDGTVWVSGNIFTPADPSTFVGVTYEGQADSNMEAFHGDAANTDWKIDCVKNAYNFQLQISANKTIPVRVSPDFGSVDAAQQEVARYGKILGQMPSFLQNDLAQIDMHKQGNHTYSANGSRHSILIYKEANDRLYGNKNFEHLEEATFHECVHAAVEAKHKDTPNYQAAMQADGVALSNYADKYPDREDLSESLLLIYAQEYKPNRLSDAQNKAIRETIPNRIAYAKKHIFQNPSLN